MEHEWEFEWVPDTDGTVAPPCPLVADYGPASQYKGNDSKGKGKGKGKGKNKGTTMDQGQDLGTSRTADSSGLGGMRPGRPPRLFHLGKGQGKSTGKGKGTDTDDQGKGGKSDAQGGLDAGPAAATGGQRRRITMRRPAAF